MTVLPCRSYYVSFYFTLLPRGLQGREKQRIKKRGKASFFDAFSDCFAWPAIS